MYEATVSSVTFPVLQHKYPRAVSVLCHPSSLIGGAES